MERCRDNHNLAYSDEDGLRVDLLAFCNFVKSRVPSVSDILAVGLGPADSWEANLFVDSGLAHWGLVVVDGSDGFLVLELTARGILSFPANNRH